MVLCNLLKLKGKKMTKKIYSIYDIKAEFYSTPWYSENDETAAREFTRVVQDPHSAINAFPHDYTLFYLGEFYSDTGHINVDFDPKLIIDGASVRGLTPSGVDDVVRGDAYHRAEMDKMDK